MLVDEGGPGARASSPGATCSTTSRTAARAPALTRAGARDRRRRRQGARPRPARRPAGAVRGRPARRARRRRARDRARAGPTSWRSTPRPGGRATAVSRDRERARAAQHPRVPHPVGAARGGTPFFDWMRRGLEVFAAVERRGSRSPPGRPRKGRAIEVFPHATAAVLAGCLPPKGCEAGVARARAAAPGRPHRGADDRSTRSTRRSLRSPGCSRSRASGSPRATRRRASSCSDERACPPSRSAERRTLAEDRRTAVRLVRVRRRVPGAGAGRVRAADTTRSASRCCGARPRGTARRDELRRRGWELPPGDAKPDDALRDAGDPRGPGARRAVRRGERPDLPDRRPTRRTPSGAPKRWDYARGGNPTRERSRRRSPRSRAARAGSRSRAGWRPRPRCCSRSRPATTSCSADDVYGGTYRLLAERAAGRGG